MTKRPAPRTYLPFLVLFLPTIYLAQSPTPGAAAARTYGPYRTRIAPKKQWGVFFAGTVGYESYRSDSLGAETLSRIDPGDSLRVFGALDTDGILLGLTPGLYWVPLESWVVQLEIPMRISLGHPLAVEGTAVGDEVPMSAKIFDLDLKIIHEVYAEERLALYAEAFAGPTLSYTITDPNGNGFKGAGTRVHVGGGMALTWWGNPFGMFERNKVFGVSLEVTYRPLVMTRFEVDDEVQAIDVPIDAYSITLSFFLHKSLYVFE